MSLEDGLTYLDAVTEIALLDEALWIRNSSNVWDRFWIVRSETDTNNLMKDWLLKRIFQSFLLSTASERHEHNHSNEMIQNEKQIIRRDLNLSVSQCLEQKSKSTIFGSKMFL